MKLGTGVVPQSVIYHTRSNWGKLKGYSNPYLHRYIHYEVALLNPQSDYKIAMILRALSKEAFCQLIFGKTGACKNVLSMAFKLWKHRHLLEGDKKGHIDF